MNRRQREIGMLGLLLIPIAAMAGSFTNAGYGTESTLMGGADVAVARDSFALNTNPAGLVQLTGKALDLHGSVFDSQGTHSDNYGNYRHMQKNQFGALGDFGYAERVPDSPYAIGVDLVVQGGVGWEYQNLNTAFGTRDQSSSLFSIVRLAPGAAWKISDRWSVGGALDVNYAAGAQSLFPNTSAAPSAQFPQGFAGVTAKDMSGTSLSGKIGMQYRPMEDVVIGATYSSKTRLPLRDGIMRVNYTNTIPGAGMVRYDDAEITGFALPEVISLGVSFRPRKDLLVALQNSWENTSDALSGITLTATHPRTTNPLVPRVITSTTQVGALDQHVYSIGAAYDWSEQTLLYVGATRHGRSIPTQNYSASFQPIQQQHYMIGFHHELGPEWSVDAGIERIVHQMVTYNNPNTPFGPSVAAHTGTPTHVQLSRRW
jgi:long-chain fatty acid transport protein